MDGNDVGEVELVEMAVVAFRERLGEALALMRAADSAVTFVAAERQLHALAQTVASELTRKVVQEKCDDKSTRQEAARRVRERAASVGVTMCSGRHRETDVRTLGGAMMRVKTPYMRGVPRGEGQRETRGAQGTGVYPVLDMLGIAGRSTPALRLQVALAVCESNSVTSAREVLSSGGTSIDHKAALRLTYMVTEDALRARRRAMRETHVGNDDGEFVDRRVAVAVDGGRVCIRRRVAGRPRKGGRKHFVTEWREPKVITIYVVDDEGKRDKEVLPVTDATLGDADAVMLDSGQLFQCPLRRQAGVGRVQAFADHPVQDQRQTGRRLGMRRSAGEVRSCGGERDFDGSGQIPNAYSDEGDQSFR